MGGLGRPDFCTEMEDAGLQDDLTQEEKKICEIDSNSGEDLGPEPNSSEEERLYRESMQAEEERQREEDQQIIQQIENGEFNG